MFNTKKFSSHTLLLALSSAGDWVSEKKCMSKRIEEVYKTGRLCSNYTVDALLTVVYTFTHTQLHSHPNTLPPLQPPSAGIHAEPYTDNLGDFLGRLPFAMFF